MMHLSIIKIFLQAKLIYLSRRKGFKSKKVVELSKENILFFFGHYEGIDERIIEEIVDEEISISMY